MFKPEKEGSFQEAPPLSPEIIRARIISTVGVLLRDQAHLIGSGLTAEVHYPDGDVDVCYKIITRRTAVGSNIPDSEVRVTYRRGSDGEERPTCNSLQLEGEFLADLRDIDAEVKVPKPFFHMTGSSEEEGDTYFVKDEISVLSMERLRAVSIRDVIDGKEPLPKTFNAESFFKKLKRFIEKMNGELGIYHRDLHAGNIMIDIESGNPRVIDFGDAAKGTADDVYQIEYTHKGKSKIWRYPHTDPDFADRVEKELRDYVHLT